MGVPIRNIQRWNRGGVIHEGVQRQEEQVLGCGGARLSGGRAARPFRERALPSLLKAAKDPSQVGGSASIHGSEAVIWPLRMALGGLRCWNQAALARECLAPVCVLLVLDTI